MNLFPPQRAKSNASVLVIVLWIAFGLVTIALYFGHSMQLEHRASDNRNASAEADQAITGAARYVSYILATEATNGAVPDVQTYQREAVQVGNATYWLIGRSVEAQALPDQAQFGLVDEASKLNLNTATLDMLTALPRMTPELAAAIIDWRDSNSDVTEGGAEDDTYLRLNPPYHCKNAPFESTDELRLVSGATLDILYGEDTNLNGILDSNENDGSTSTPEDNSDGRLDPGILEYVTVYSRQPNTRTNGATRIDVTKGAQSSAAFTQLLQERGFEAQRVQQLAGILTSTTAGAASRGTSRATATRGATAAAAAGTSYNSTLAFYIAGASRAAMTVDEFALIANDITTTNLAFIDGLINVNTASEAVLSCIPGIGTTNASALVAYRQQNPDKLTSVAWIVETIGAAAALQAGPYITSESYQFTADIAAVGHLGRGYKRVRYIFDTTEITTDGSTKILNRRDLTNLGWALGKTARQDLLTANQTR